MPEPTPVKRFVNGDNVPGATRLNELVDSINEAQRLISELRLARGGVGANNTRVRAFKLGAPIANANGYYEIVLYDGEYKGGPTSGLSSEHVGNLIGAAVGVNLLQVDGGGSQLAGGYFFGMLSGRVGQDGSGYDGLQIVSFVGILIPPKSAPCGGPTWPTPQAITGGLNPPMHLVLIGGGISPYPDPSGLLTQMQIGFAGSGSGSMSRPLTALDSLYLPITLCPTSDNWSSTQSMQIVWQGSMPFYYAQSGLCANGINVMVQANIVDAASEEDDPPALEDWYVVVTASISLNLLGGGTAEIWRGYWKEPTEGATGPFPGTMIYYMQGTNMRVPLSWGYPPPTNALADTYTPAVVTTLANRSLALECSLDGSTTIPMGCATTPPACPADTGSGSGGGGGSGTPSGSGSGGGGGTPSGSGSGGGGGGGTGGSGTTSGSGGSHSGSGPILPTGSGYSGSGDPNVCWYEEFTALRDCPTDGGTTHWIVEPDASAPFQSTDAAVAASGATLGTWALDSTTDSAADGYCTARLIHKIGSSCGLGSPPADDYTPAAPTLDCNCNPCDCADTSSGKTYTLTGTKTYGPTTDEDTGETTTPAPEDFSITLTGNDCSASGTLENWPPGYMTSIGASLNTSTCQFNCAGAIKTSGSTIKGHYGDTPDVTPMYGPPGTHLSNLNIS